MSDPPLTDPQLQDPLANWPDRTQLRDESGVVVIVFSAAHSTRDLLPWADGVWVPPGVTTARAVEVCLQAMPGWRFSTSDRALAEAMLAAGAMQLRRAHTMSHPLGAPRPTPDGVGATVRVERLTQGQLERHARALGAVSVRAYPPGHPDAVDDEAGAVSQLRAIARGDLLGPMMPESRIALVDSQIVGACLLVDRPGDPPHAGPWVIDIFRDPDCPVPGVGTALLGDVLAAAAEAGLPAVSLVVSHDNPGARALYRRLGFTEVDESWTLALPKEGERPA